MPSDWWKNYQQALEHSPEEMAAFNSEAFRRIQEFIMGLPKSQAMGTALDPQTHDCKAGFALPYEPCSRFPEQGASFESAMDLIFERLVPTGQLPSHPGYVAYVPGGGIYLAALGQLIGMAINPFTGMYATAPGLLSLETEVLQCLCTMVGYPATARGLLTSGASLATLTALTTARNSLLPENFLRGTLYVGDQAHHCVAKAAALAGFPVRNVRLIPSDKDYRIDLRVLSERITRDRAEGFTPFFVTGSAGTTNTGAIDDLAALADLAKREKLWFHVDGAYGGVFMLTDFGREKLKGISEADSIALDPHKGLCLPYGTGCLLVRDGARMRVSHAGASSYLPPTQDEGSAHEVDFCEISPELSRDFRGLRVWLPIHVMGIGPFRRNLEEKLELTRWLAGEIAATPGLEVVSDPQLTVVAFAVKGRDAEAANAATRALMARINEEGSLFLSGCSLGGRFVLRICLLSFRVHYERLERGLRAVRELLN